VKVCAFEVLGAEVATAFGIKRDVDVVGIHHTAGTDAERSGGHREQTGGFKTADKLTNKWDMFDDEIEKMIFVSYEL